MKTTLRKLIALALVFAMSFALIACAAGTEKQPAAAAPAEAEPEAPAAAEAEPAAEPEAEPQEEASAEGLHLAFFLKSSINQVWLDAQEGAEECAVAYGATLDVLSPTTPESNEEQVNQVLDYVAKGVDAMVISPADVYGIVSAIDAAREAGIKVIIAGDVVKDTEIDGTVLIDNKDAAYTVAKVMCEKLGGKGNVIVITGVLGTVAAQLLEEGAMQAFAEYPEIKVLKSQTAKWQRTESMKVMEDMLQTYDQIDAVFASNDEMALGAVEAIKAAGKEGILVCGLDATADGTTAVLNGDICIDIDKNWKGVGYLAVENAIKAALGQEYDIDDTVETKLIDASNAEEHLKTKK